MLEPSLYGWVIHTKVLRLQHLCRPVCVCLTVKSPMTCVQGCTCTEKTEVHSSRFYPATQLKLCQILTHWVSTGTWTGMLMYKYWHSGLTVAVYIVHVHPLTNTATADHWACTTYVKFTHNYLFTCNNNIQFEYSPLKKDMYHSVN